MNAGNFLSPEALVIIPLALTLDVIGIILICFALDDFFVTDIIGWATIGVWASFRSQARGNPESGMPDRKERKAQAEEMRQQFRQNQPKETKTVKVSKTAKAAKWAKWLRFLEFVPYLGVLPFWTASAFFTLAAEDE